tara:strand:- start:351 stop:1430 length:1080 start_codon:yes stop_codon:yes gene_type:complete
MLEQAIVDAGALRAAAIESAEKVVIEKYSEQIKDTVEALLEQDEPEAQDADAEFATKGVNNLDSQLPESFHPEIDDNKILEIDLNSIDLDLDDNVDLLDEEELRQAISEALEEEEKEEGLEEAVKPDFPDVDGDGDTEEPIAKAAKDKKDKAKQEESVELEEENLEELAETLKFDYKRQPDGGFANGQMKPVAAHDTDNVLAQEVSEMIDQYNSEFKEENEKLKKENKVLRKKLKDIMEGKKELVDAVHKIQNKFNEVQLMNAKLYYTNRALVDNSLNERQKNKIVESINNADSIEKAKIVYETLQDAVGTVKKGQESLSEVVGKRTSSSILLKSHKADKSKDKNYDFSNRMKRLAGLS